MVVYMAAAMAMYVWVLPASGPQGRPPVFMMALSMLAVLLALVVFGGFFLTLNPERRALHDLVAGTVVLRPGELPQGFAPLMPAIHSVPTTRETDP